MAQELEWHDADAPKADASGYDKFVTAASKRYDVPEHWINTVIEHESKGNPKAWRAEPAHGEGVGTRGLMQLMPGTARDLGFKGDDFDELYDPETNIDLGTKYISQLRKKFGDSFERIYSAYNSGDPDAYKTRADVKEHVAQASKVFNQNIDWHDGDDPEIQKQKLAEVTAAGDKAREFAESPLSYIPSPDQPGFVPGVVRNLRDAYRYVTSTVHNLTTFGGLETDPKKVMANVERVRQLIEGNPVDLAAASVPTGIGTQALETARRAQSGDVGGAVADIVTPLAIGEAVPRTLRAAGDFAETYKPSSGTLKTAAKGGAKIAGSSIAAAAETHIPGVGIPLSMATEWLGLRGGISDLVEAARRYKGDVYANKLAKTLSKKAEFIQSEIPHDIPSWQSMHEEPPIDVTPGAVITPAKTGIPATLADFQQLTSGRQPLQLSAPSGPATVATETAPGEGGVPTPSEEALPQIYRNVGPKTPAGTTATIGKQSKTPAGEQTVVATPKPEEPAATQAAPKTKKSEERMPFKDWMKRMTSAQLKHVRRALDLVEDEAKYDELQKAIDEATEK